MRRAPTRQRRCAIGERGSRAVGFLTGGAEFRPDVFGVRSPLGAGQAGDLEVVFAQSAVSIDADVLGTRAAELQDAAPGAGCDGHSQTAQADPAAVALVPYDEVKGAGEKKKTQQKDEVAEQKAH